MTQLVTHRDQDRALAVRLAWRSSRTEAVEGAVRRLSCSLDQSTGFLFQCAVTQAGRYAPKGRGSDDIGIAFEGRGRAFRISLLHYDFGPVFDAFVADLKSNPDVVRVIGSEDVCVGMLTRYDIKFSEEERTRQPSTMRLLRRLSTLIRCDDPELMGWHGAFGYDLMMGFDPVVKHQRRGPDCRDVAVFLPRTVVCWDDGIDAMTVQFGVSESADVPGSSVLRERFQQEHTNEVASGDPCAAKYEAGVRQAKELFKNGNAFEIVLSHVFGVRSQLRPCEVYRALIESNPSPYHFLVNLGRGESIVGASPEMYVKVTGDRVETCPVSGTIRRGANAVEDAQRVRELLESEKDAAELTMCTDVDRNDKSRVAIPGTVQIIARRQIEMYSRLIHTVDHVVGRLAPEFDAWDAFLTHMWAVTVTGAPKHAAVQFIEATEDSARRWYGGAVGYIALNGDMDTGLTLRATRATREGYEVRAGATLLIDSDPEAEQLETRLKASAIIAAITGKAPDRTSAREPVLFPEVSSLETLLVDFEDSFVHTLAGYLRQVGCNVRTFRWDQISPDCFDVDLVVLSPGPGTPSDFGVANIADRARLAGATVFGVCLGMQGIVESVGGSLNGLPSPMHGRSSRITMTDSPSELLRGVSHQFSAGRYHSLFAEHIPPPLQTTSIDDDGIAMSVESPAQGLYAVQFHPESLLSLGDGVGLTVIDNIVRIAERRAQRRQRTPALVAESESTSSASHSTITEQEAL